MIHYYKFRQELFDPQPARDVYIKHTRGRGWPEECPPIRAANAFGFDLLANFDVEFVQWRGTWRAEPDIAIESDFGYSSGTDDSGGDEPRGAPLRQQYAWFWQKGQKLPHVISDDVYPHIAHQVKVSSYLFLKTDPNELLMFTDVPNAQRPWRAMTAVVDTDWYPASYPWHCVLELDKRQRRIRIERGQPLCRIIPLRRDTYFARPMSRGEFGDFFDRSQQWLATHGRAQHEGTVDITRTYVRQQAKSRFIVNG